MSLTQAMITVLDELENKVTSIDLHAQKRRSNPSDREQGFHVQSRNSSGATVLGGVFAFPLLVVPQRRIL
jgi:hypothetical protein